MERVSKADATRLRNLEQRLGSRTVRTILTREDRRLMRPERMENLKSGRGKMSEDERKLLDTLSREAGQIKRLQSRRTSAQKAGKKRVEWKVNRSLRDWVQHGKERDAPGKDQRVIRALAYLDVEPSDKTFYHHRKGR